MTSDSTAGSGTLLILAAVAVLVTTGTACTSTGGGMRGREYADITPFAQTTVEVVGLQNIRLRDSDLVYLRPYADDEDFVELNQLQALLDQTDTFRDRVISYSVDLVLVTEMHTSEKDTVAAYADSIDSLLKDSVIDAEILSEQGWNEILTDIRAAPDFLAALRAFQPVINEAGTFYDDLLTEIESEVLVEVRAGFDRRIMAEYGPPIRFLESYIGRRDEIFAGLVLTDVYRHGDAAAADRLREGNIVLDRSLIPKGAFTTKDIDAIEKALRDELTVNTNMLDQIKEDDADFQATRAELDRKEAEVIASLGLARLQFLTWARSHQALANGVEEPGKWMELSVKAGKLLSKAL